MIRPTFLPSILALIIACSETREATSSNPIRHVSGSFTRRIAFAPSLHVSPLKARSAATTAKAGWTNNVSRENVHIVGLSPNRQISSLHMMSPSPISFDVVPHHLVSSPSLSFPSIITSIDDASEAFQDDVSLSDLTSDPFLQAAFAASVVAIILLVVAKAIVTQMDEAVGQVALDFDRVMRLKYPKKWGKFIDGRDDIRADRIQKIVEEMEIMSKEEPEFMERVMRDVERKI